MLTRLRNWRRQKAALDTHAVPQERWRQAQGYEENYWVRMAREGYFRMPKSLFESWHPMVQAWNLWGLGFDYEQVQDKVLLEIGCGPLGLVAAAPMPKAIGIDPLAAQYSKLFPLAAHPCQYLAAPGEAIPLTGDSVDLAVCINALDHMQDPFGTLCEIHRVLKPGGRLLLTLNLHFEPDPGHPTQFNQRAVEAMLARAGFRILHGSLSASIVDPQHPTYISVVAER